MGDPCAFSEVVAIGDMAENLTYRPYIDADVRHPIAKAGRAYGRLAGMPASYAHSARSVGRTDSGGM